MHVAFNDRISTRSPLLGSFNALVKPFDEYLGSQFEVEVAMCIARRPIVFLVCVAISSSVIGGIGLWAQQSGDAAKLDSAKTSSLLARAAQAAYESAVSALSVGGADVDDVYR